MRVDAFKKNTVRFLEGRAYPPLVGVLALFSSLASIEIFAWSIISGLIFLSAVLSDSAKPIATAILLIPLFVSARHSPSHTVSLIYGDGNTSYYFTGWRLPLFTVSALLILLGLVIYFIRNKCYGQISPRRDAIFIPTVILSVVFLLGGVGSEGYLSGIPLSLLELVSFAILYLFFAYGFRERDGELAGWLSYNSLIITLVIILQLAVLFCTSEIIFLDGGINKEGVILGWGIWTVIGAYLASQIPALLFGVLKGDRLSPVYFAAATLALIFSLLTMSRSAQLLSVGAYAISLLILSVKSKGRIFYRAYIAVILLAAALFSLLQRERLGGLFRDFFADNGRVAHAKIAIRNFLEYPVFGVGFSGFEGIERLPAPFAPMGPLPAMAHNTPLQLLSATGAVGLLSYIVYRIASIVPVLKKRKLSSVFALMSSSVVLLGGLVDNFPFDLYPMHYSVIALAVSQRADD